MPRPRKYPDELRERAVRLVFDSGRPIAQVAKDLGVHREALRLWVRQAEADAGSRDDRLTTAERERLKELEREVRDLRKANEILKAASVFFAKELDGTPRRSAPSSTRSAVASPSSSSATRSGCRRRPTTSAPPGCGRHARSRMSGCWHASAPSTARTTRPMGRGGCGVSCSAAARPRRAARSSG